MIIWLCLWQDLAWWFISIDKRPIKDYIKTAIDWIQKLEMMGAFFHRLKVFIGPIRLNLRFSRQSAPKSLTGSWSSFIIHLEATEDSCRICYMCCNLPQPDTTQSEASNPPFPYIRCRWIVFSDSAHTVYNPAIHNTTRNCNCFQILHF